MLKLRLSTHDTGCWLVRTGTAWFLLDLDRRRAVRSDLSGRLEFPAGCAVWEIAKVTRCHVGEPLVLLTRSTRRSAARTLLFRSTPVRCIVPATAVAHKKLLHSASG
jgi:hypothetical protein